LAGRGARDGSGLGLAIARELAARAHATLTAGNGAAGGAVLTLAVPLAPDGARRVVRFAPVATHAALAQAQAVLDTAGEWMHVDWRDGVLTVSLETDADAAGNLAAASATGGFACWSAAG